MPPRYGNEAAGATSRQRGVEALDRRRPCSSNASSPRPSTPRRRTGGDVGRLARPGPRPRPAEQRGRATKRWRAVRPLTTRVSWSRRVAPTPSLRTSKVRWLGRWLEDAPCSPDPLSNRTVRPLFRRTCRLPIRGGPCCTACEPLRSHRSIPDPSGLTGPGSDG